MEKQSIPTFGKGELDKQNRKPRNPGKKRETYLTTHF